MRILCTFPGKFGDLLWALPTLRALASRINGPVDLLIAAPFVSIGPLLEAQDYIGRCVASETWQTFATAPISPRIPPDREDVISPYDHTFHLGYRDWPKRPLPYETLDCLNTQWTTVAQGTGFEDILTPIHESDLRLADPWIRVEGPAPPVELVCGFTDEYFELKVGLVTLLDDLSPHVLIHDTRIRWAMERPAGSYRIEGPNNWLATARVIRNADLFLGDCSALHVLAVALGRPVVLMEPQSMRHHPIFYPLGMDGPQVTVVKGVDGLPTFDARAVREALERELARRTEEK